MQPHLYRYGFFAAMLGMAGLPIYIHAPKFFVDTYGIGLGELGIVLFLLRLLDVVQDPLLGALAARRHGKGRSIWAMSLLMSIAMFGLFAYEAPIAPLWWFALCLALVFSSFSYLSICFYARGVTTGQSLGEGGHIKVAAWREPGTLIGICFAAALPSLLLEGGLSNRTAFTVFAWSFVALSFIATLLMRSGWTRSIEQEPMGFGLILRDPPARQLLVIAFLNAAPVAVSSTLFLYYVESVLVLGALAGPLLLVFFLAAAAAAPLWTRLAERYGAKPMLIIGMILAILSFFSAFFLGQGDALGFGIICLTSGAALGADMTLLPALFARRMAQIAPSAAEGFGLWNFVSKATLAVASITLLPLLEWQGFAPGQVNAGAAQIWLAGLYALLPCGLKLAAIGYLATYKGESSDA